MKCLAKALLLMCFALLESTILLADSPALLKDYIETSENGQYEFRMYVPSHRSRKPRSEQSGLYLVESADSKPLWSVDDWYSANVIPHSNGRNLLRFGPWASETSDLAVAFYADGKELKKYLIHDLVKDDSKLSYSASHFSWQSENRYDESTNTLTIATLDRIEYVFSLLSGGIESEKRFEIDDFEKLQKMVRRQPGQVQFASDRIKESPYFLKQLIRINEAVIRYLPNTLKNDISFVLSAVAVAGVAYRHIPENMKKDRAIALLALNAPGFLLRIDDIDESIVLDEELVYTAVANVPSRYDSLEEHWKKDETLLKLALVNGGGFSSYNRAHVSLRKKKDVVLAAIASEYDTQVASLRRYVGYKHVPFKKTSSSREWSVSHIQHFSYVPVEFLNDKDVIEEYDKLLLVLVELDDTKLPAIRAEAYAIIRDYGDQADNLSNILIQLLPVANNSGVVSVDSMQKCWQEGLFGQFEKDGLKVASDFYLPAFVNSLWSMFELNGFEYSVDENKVSRHKHYLDFGLIKLMATTEYAASTKMWNEAFVSNAGNRRCG